MNQAAASPSPPARSAFVTAVAWVFIVLAGFATLIAVMQAMMFAFMFPAAELPSIAGTPRELQAMPAPLRFLLQNIWLIFAAYWSLAALTLVAAVGLLLRRNWARLLFVALMGLGIAWNAGALWLQQQMLASMPRMSSRAPAGMAPGFDTMATVMGIGMAAFAVVVAVIFGWIAVRLMSGAVKAEFKAR
jgi:hypothetical protein